MALSTPAGWLILPLGVVSVILGTAKTWRVRSVAFYLPFALAQAAAAAAMVYTLVGPLFPTSAVSTQTLLLFLVGGVATAGTVIVDLLISLRFVLTSASPDRSLSARTAILLSLTPCALGVAALFRLGWNWTLVQTTPVPDSEGSYPLYLLLSLGAASADCVFVIAAALLSVVPTPGGGVRGDRCARVWFGLLFLACPASAVVTGVAALLAPKELSGGFLLQHAALAAALVNLGTALMRDMLNNGRYVDPVGAQKAEFYV